MYKTAYILINYMKFELITFLFKIRIYKIKCKTKCIVVTNYF